MISHKSPISGIATYADKYIATAGYDNTVILWNSKLGTSIARGCHDHLVNQCTFSSCGNFLATSSSDYTARIWSVPSMKLMTVLNGHSDDVEGLSFHSEKSLFATCSRDKSIQVYDLEGKLVNKLVGHQDDIISVEWIKGKDVLVSSSDDGTVKYWNAFDGKILKDLSFNDVQTDTIAIANDGTIFAGNDDGEIVILKNDEEPILTPAHKAGIKRLVYSDEVSRLISLSYDRSFKVWLYENGTLKEEYAEQFVKIVWPRSCAFLNKDEIVFGTFGNKYAIFNLSKKEWITQDIEPTHGINAVLELNNNVYYVGDSGIVYENGKAITKLGSLCNFLVNFEGHVITGGQSGEIFDAITGEIYYQHSSPLNCGTSFSHLGSPTLMIGAYTGEGIVLSISKSDNKIKFDSIVKLHENAIKGISASGKLIFSVCATSAAAFHSTDNFECISYIKNGHNKIANGCVALGQKGFASVSRDLYLRIWIEGVSKTISTPHSNSIKCISSDLSGRYLVLGDYVGHISIYDSQEGKWLKSERISDFGISNICYSNSRNIFIASSYNGKLYDIKI